MRGETHMIQEFSGKLFLYCYVAQRRDTSFSECTHLFFTDLVKKLCSHVVPSHSALNPCVACMLVEFSVYVCSLKMPII